MYKRTAISLTFLLSISIMIALIWNYTHLGSKADIAIYAGRGTWDLSVQALERMFFWMNYTVELIGADYIDTVGLATFRILVIPGGDMYEYAQDISPKGKEIIRTFVQDGGGYIGICGGAYFASEEVFWQGNQLPMTPLGLFAGTATGPIDEITSYPNYTMCKVNIINHDHPVTESERDSEWMLYYWGPALTPNRDANIAILGNYDRGNQTAMLAFDYYKGKVFLVSTHPEIEEDNDRDGVSFGNELDDQGSDWDLMQKAVLWSIKHTP